MRYSMNCPYCSYPLPVHSGAFTHEAMRAAGKAETAVVCGTCKAVMVMQLYPITPPSQEWRNKPQRNLPAPAESYCNRCSSNYPEADLNSRGGLCVTCWKAMTQPTALPGAVS